MSRRIFKTDMSKSVNDLYGLQKAVVDKITYYNVSGVVKLFLVSDRRGG